MRTLKFNVRIGDDHRVVLDVPRDTPVGPAEVLVLVPEPEARNTRSLEELMVEFERRAAGRSKAELDAELAAERATWGE